jgi:hypothetical protein
LRVLAELLRRHPDLPADHQVADRL